MVDSVANCKILNLLSFPLTFQPGCIIFSVKITRALKGFSARVKSFQTVRKPGSPSGVVICAVIFQFESSTLILLHVHDTSTVRNLPPDIFRHARLKKQQPLTP
jgi:hypothetical protein